MYTVSACSMCSDSHFHFPISLEKIPQILIAVFIKYLNNIYNSQWQKDTEFKYYVKIFAKPIVRLISWAFMNLHVFAVKLETF